ncbi:uncharacterized protein NMK_1396 [Novimethylophilus kurashikiensis]|uniref:DUF58 domain-containing protein n=1 Tax=Novimethylophilus kurashikiensis TaxID=1825523 RepID=A0A2R5FB38_9PROT|nr:DUF58 domain-containing protein [Novimethylophilus kurashikiensis]GBG13844.1 uncharacterized protein NMK_1396 [Novimethylophilus kurashikiensis]
MIPEYSKPFTYAVSWKSSSQHLGDHRGTERGLGFEYRSNVPLVDYPDPRRLDLRQTLRDPYEQIQVRLYNQDNTTPVYAVCDLSGSMQYKGQQRKLDKAREIAASVALSAFNMGDVFSFIAYDSEVLEDYTLPLSHHLHQAMEVIDALKEHSHRRVGGEGVLEVPQFLSQSRSLVIWISDFHMPLPLLEQALNAMSRHQIVPVVLWDAKEYRQLPKFGFGTMIDPESGENRTVFFRQALREKFLAAFEARREALKEVFLRFDCPPLFMEAGYSADIMSAYFEQYASL